MHDHMMIKMIDVLLISVCILSIHVSILVIQNMIASKLSNKFNIFQKAYINVLEIRTS